MLNCPGKVNYVVLFIMSDSLPKVKFSLLGVCVHSCRVVFIISSDSWMPANRPAPRRAAGHADLCSASARPLPAISAGTRVPGLDGFGGNLERVLFAGRHDPLLRSEPEPEP